MPEEPILPDAPKRKGLKVQATETTTPEVDSVRTKEPATETPSATSIWSSFTLANAWDDVPGISRYVERSRGHRRGKSSQVSIQAPKAEDVPETSAKKKASFHGLKLTDFPTEVERPSLPVTPAPIRRPSFWGDEGQESESNDAPQNVPKAEGVPAQAEWVSDVVP